MKCIKYSFILLLFITNLSFSQSRPPDGCVTFVNRNVGSIMGFTDCENINDSTCVPIKGMNGILLHGYDGQSGHIWVYEKDMISKEFDMPGDEYTFITDTADIVMPVPPTVRDYCGGTYEDTDTTICWVMESRLVPIGDQIEYVNIGVVWEKKWTVKNDRSTVQPDSILIDRRYEDYEVTYTFVYKDCLLDRHEWVFTYYLENKQPTIFTKF